MFYYLLTGNITTSQEVTYDEEQSEELIQVMKEINSSLRTNKEESLNELIQE